VSSSPSTSPSTSPSPGSHGWIYGTNNVYQQG
jgi:hypothetical protein